MLLTVCAIGLLALALILVVTSSESYDEMRDRRDEHRRSMEALGRAARPPVTPPEDDDSEPTHEENR